MEQVLAAMGPRDPPAARSQTLFNIGFVYLLEPGQTPDPEQLAFHAEFRDRTVEHWRRITSGRSQMTTAVAILPTSRECPAGSPTWMGLPVCEEGARAGYDRNGFGSAYSSLEDEIIDDLPKSWGQVYTPYTCTLFDIRDDGTAATDIEHIVALAEAYDSVLAESKFRTFAGDLDNLTIADPTVNRSQKSDRDAGELGPPQNSGWFAARVVAVKQKYALSVNPAERDALQAMLNSDASRTVTCGEPAAEVGEQDAAALDFAHFANGDSITSELVFVNVATHPIRPAL